MGKHIGKTLLSEQQILRRVQELGQQISNDYRGEEVIIVCVLKGAVVFLADLLRSIDVPTDLDFVQISSYGDGTESTGVVEVLHCPTTEIEDRHVLIVDDIVDSGLTLNHLRESLLTEEPASLKLCVLLNKMGRRTEDVEMDYVGFEIPNEFVIGYGLDYAGRYRSLRYIATLEL
ncbi:hypoxanthine phosphoribosyltransferase [Candidatus Poribacteria bacterium]